MNFEKLEFINYCVGQKQYSGTKKIVGEIKFSKKTRSEIKLLVGQCSLCNRKKSMNVSDNTIKTAKRGDFFKNLGKKDFIISKKMAKKVLKNTSRALDTAANIATAAASRKFKKVKMYHQYYQR